MPIAYYDNHLHSCHSFDASDSLTDICEVAIRRGLAGISITDHCDFGCHKEPDWRECLLASVEDTLLAKAQFSDVLSVFVGIELGQPLFELPLALEALNTAPFDVVLCSLHNLSDKEGFYFLGDAENKEALLWQYFQELLEIVRWNQFDVLTHLTYCCRYFGNATPNPSIRLYEEILRELFKTLAQNGKALELNLSGLYNSRRKKTMPELWELKLFRESGGELVSLGSDAHTAQNVGACLKDGIDLLQTAGFEYQVHFENRLPRLSRIV